MNGKIKEWHLDEDLLLKLIREGADIASVLTNYVKKTDIISKNQLNNDVFTEVNNRITVLISQLEKYRLINNPIAETDLTPSLQTKIRDLQNTVDALVEFVSGQPLDLQTLINNSIEEKIASSSYLTDLKREITTDLENGPIARLHSSFSTLQNTVNALNNQFTTFQETADSRYRRSNIAITTEDLNGQLQTLLSDHTSNISSLQLQKQDKVGGNAGQIIAVNPFNSLIPQDHILCENIVETMAELNTMRDNLASPIIFYNKQLSYKIRKNPWNHALEINKTSNNAYTNVASAMTTFKANDVSIAINDGIVTAANNSLSDYGDISFGFYGTRCKIAFAISDNIILHFFIDNAIHNIIFYANDTSKDLCIENLSEGPHVIRFVIEPDTTLVFSKGIGIDNTHAGLLIAVDIPDESMYKNNMYDTGDYFDFSTASGTYTFTKNNVSKITPETAYTAGWFDINSYEGRVIFSKENLKLYYCKNNTFIQLR